MAVKRCFGFSFAGNRGLSAVVTTLLIILLSIIAIGVVWVVVKNVVDKGSEQINLGQFTLDLSIKNAYIDGSDVKVGVRRSPGQGEISGIKFIFYNGTDSSIVQKDVSLGPLDAKTFSFNSTEVGGIDSVQRVSVAPVYVSSGKSVTGDITDTAEILSSPPPGVGGGSGTGTGTGGGGSGSGGGSGTGDPGTGFCGDGIIQDPNSDGISEQCDGSNLNSQTCSTLGFGTGTLSCDAGCQFDSTLCSQGTPSSCDGVWNQTDIDDGNECDGGGSPGNVPNCQTTCICETGFGPDGSGNCVLDPPVDTGVIYSVWNKIYFDSDNLPTDPAIITSYIGMYANFSGSLEVGCFQINYADVADTGRGYVRLDNSLGVPNINSGEGYIIWEAANCGQ